MSLVESFTYLKGRAKQHEALPLLQRIASLVKPVMRNHGWKLPVLAEFFPENESLVGSCTIMSKATVYYLLPSNRIEYVSLIPPKLLLSFMSFRPDVNGGQKILLRLRPPWAPDTFYDEEQLVLVMLHEVLYMVFPFQSLI